MKSRNALAEVSSTAVTLAAAILAAVSFAAGTAWAEGPGVVWLEAEDAVATNFAGEATLDYGSSAYRALRLNRDGRDQSAPFYAEYAFFLPEAGSYELWLGGTPPGPRGEETASYVSPARYRVDEGSWRPLYREDVAVVERYSAQNHWSLASEPLALEAGLHTLRLEVSEGRRHDARYYFALDALFLVHRGSIAASGAGVPPGAPVGAPFPSKPTNRSLDRPYLSLAQYEYAVTQSPKDPNSYLILAQVYNLIGDHGSAAKALTKGRLAAGDEPRLLLELARSRLWSGEADDGLRLFREYLSAGTASASEWAEAAKTAAWLMRYREAEGLYREALLRFPGDATLEVNLALTLLWSGRGAEGEAMLSSVLARSLASPEEVMALGSVYQANGYPDKSAAAYEEGIRRYEAALGLREGLARVLFRSGRRDEADRVVAALASLEGPGTEGARALADRLLLEASLRDGALERLRERSLASPEDLGLRAELSRAYLWNGMLPEALSVGRGILAARLYGALREADEELEETWRLIDGLALLKTSLAAIPKTSAQAAKALTAAMDRLKKAEASYGKAEASASKAAVAAQKADKPSIREREEARLAAALAALEAARIDASKALSAVRMRAETIEAAHRSLDGLLRDGETEAAKIEADEELLARLSPWAWSPSLELPFLSKEARADPLARYALLRLTSITPDGLASAPPPAGDYGEAAPRSLAAIEAQLEVWQGGALPEGFDPGSYFTRGAWLADLAADLAAAPATDPASLLPRAEPGLGADETALGVTAEEAALALSALESAERSALERAKDLPSRLTALRERAAARVALRAYAYDLEAKTDRRALADILLALGRPAEAASQLGRALAVAPGDTATLFTLGRAYETAGDWQAARGAYAEAYATDPRYGSAAASHNALARAHPIGLEARAASTIESSESAFASGLGLRVPLSSLAALKADYVANRRKIHSPPAGARPESLSLHEALLALPLSLSPSSPALTLVPRAGLALSNRLDELSPAPLSAPSALGSIADLTAWLSRYAVVAPSLGLEASIRSAGLMATLAYRFGQLEDTFFHGRLTHYEHAGRLGLSYYAASPERDWARSLGLSAFGDAAYAFSPSGFATANWLFSAGAEAVLGSAIVLGSTAARGDSGRLQLDLAASASWRHALKPGSPDYYAPNHELTLRAGPMARLLLGKDDEGIAIGLDARPGLYAQAGDPRFSAAGGLSIAGSGAGLRLKASLDASWTAASAAAPAYWSATAGLYATAGMAELLAP